MFDSKKDNLFSAPKTSGTSTTSAFVNAGLKHSSVTHSENGAVKYKTTGNEFVDQFSSLGLYRSQRAFSDISSDMSKLWAVNPKYTIMFTLFIRLITRVVSLFDGSKTSKVQKGAGLRYEGIMRMIWVALYHPESFAKNLNLFISVGSWKDIIQMLSYDLQFNGWKDRKLDWDFLGDVLLAGLENPNTSNLVKKYLPQIKARSKCTTINTQADTMIGKWLAHKIYGDSVSKQESYKRYRKLKVSGNAHTWQQLISKGKMLEIDFNSIHGRALMLLVSSKFLENQGLTAKYTEFIKNKPVAKFTGYVYELFAKYANQHPYNIQANLAQEYTLNAQFLGLVEKYKTEGTNNGLIVVRDVSFSMNGQIKGVPGLSANIVAKSLALMFSYILPDGPFKNTWIKFARTAEMVQWAGSTPSEKWKNDFSNVIGNTNFQSVIDLFCRLKTQGISEESFPTGILCISDGEFDSSSLNQTNLQSMYQKLHNAGFSTEYINNFKVVLWNIPNEYYYSDTSVKFETYGDAENVFYLSGFDPSIISFLLGGEENTSNDTKESVTPKTAYELFEAAMSQEILEQVEV